MKWYEGPCILEVLDAFKTQPLPIDAPFRLPVQGVYRFGLGGDRRRIVAGTVESGRLRVGERVVFYPSGKESVVGTIESFRPEQRRRSLPPISVHAGVAAGFTLAEQIYVRRGEVATRAGEPPPHVTKRVLVNLFWLGKRPMTKERTYLMKIGTAKVKARIEEVRELLDASNLCTMPGKEQVDRHDVALCVLDLDEAIACDAGEGPNALARFVIVDDYEIAGGGIVRQSLEREVGEASTPGGATHGALPEAPSWRGSAISPLDRSRRLRQSATLVLVSGENEADVAEMTRGIEAGLFAGGLLVYGLHLGLEERAKPEPAATVAWLSSVAGPLIDAGMILVAGVPRLSDDLAQRLESAAGAQRCLRLWVGGGPGIGGAQRVALDDPPETVAARLKPELTERNSTHEED